ncbi:hypothetical protein BZA77DRAFT_317916 [Pyronema omphalodes]|nr:hypothetical protein BZA77DRAFT_317916 [Pyronema omphalodes]
MLAHLDIAYAPTPIIIQPNIGDTRRTLLCGVDRVLLILAALFSCILFVTGSEFNPLLALARRWSNCRCFSQLTGVCGGANYAGLVGWTIIAAQAGDTG